MEHVHRRALAPVFFTLLLGGCASYPLYVPQPDPAGQTHTETAYVLAWGAVADTTVAENCDITNALDSVIVRNNLGYDLISIATLGFVRPLDLEYKCSVGQTDVGTFE